MLAQESLKSVDELKKIIESGAEVYVYCKVGQGACDGILAIDPDNENHVVVRSRITKFFLKNLSKCISWRRAFNLATGKEQSMWLDREGR